MRAKLFLIPLSILFVLSCQQEEMDYNADSPSNAARMEFTGSFGDVTQTRTSSEREGDNLKILWSPGESINIFYGDSGESSGSQFISQNSEPVPSATFTGTITAFTGISEGGEALSFWSVYPYSSSNRCDGNSVIAELPSVQNAVEENIKDNTVLMVAKAPGLALPFYNVCSFIRFSVVNSDITSVRVRVNNGEIVAGRVRVAMASEGNPSWSEIEGEGSTSITLNTPEGGVFEAGKFYYVAILPGSFENGYSMDFYTRGGREGTRRRNSAINFERAKTTYQPQRDNGVTWQPQSVDMGDGLKWATMNVGASSPEEYGDYFAWGETSPKGSYSWDNYKWATYSSAGPNITKYNSNSAYSTVDGRTTLLREDAAVNWGGDWRTPTVDEWNWLKENCTMESVTQNGVAGYKFTSNVTGYEGNSIFFPAAGYYLSSLNGVGSLMSYWEAMCMIGIIHP